MIIAPLCGNNSNVRSFLWSLMDSSYGPKVYSLSTWIVTQTFVKWQKMNWNRFIIARIACARVVRRTVIYFILLLAIITMSRFDEELALGREGHLNGTLLRSPVVGVMQANQVSVLVKGTQAGLVRIEYHKIGDTTSSFTEWGRLSYSRDQ